MIKRSSDADIRSALYFQNRRFHNIITMIKAGHTARRNEQGKEPEVVVSNPGIGIPDGVEYIASVIV